MLKLAHLVSTRYLLTISPSLLEQLYLLPIESSLVWVFAWVTAALVLPPSILHQRAFLLEARGALLSGLRN